jgi:hypothetical protein
MGPVTDDLAAVMSYSALCGFAKGPKQASKTPYPCESRRQSSANEGIRPLEVAVVDVGGHYSH